jgi:hypothetical protein
MTTRPIAILDVGRMDHDTHQQAGSVGHDMALTAFDLLGRIVTRNLVSFANSRSTTSGGVNRQFY